MRQICVVALMVAVAASMPSSSSELPPEWRHWSRFREIDTGGAAVAGELVAVALPDELWEQAGENLADLRVIDSDGEEVGFLLSSPGRRGTKRWRRTEISDRGIVPGRHAQVIVDTGTDHLLHNTLEVTLENGEGEAFAWAEVAASADGDTWRLLRAQAPLYRFAEERFRGPVTIGYPRTRDRWLRLRILGAEQALEIATVRVAERSEAERDYVPVRRSLSRLAESPDGESVWQPDGELSRLPIAGVRVATAREAFHRPVVVGTSEDGERWTTVARGHVFRHPALSDGSAGGEGLELEVRETTAPSWRVTIEDRGDPPIDDLDVTLLRHRRELVFRSSAPGPLRLLYGNPQAAATKYELASLVSEDQISIARRVDLGLEQVNDSYVSGEPFTERHPAVLWTALLVAVLVVGGLAVGVLRSTT